MEIKEPLLNHWYNALSSKFGIELVVSNPDYARVVLYKARREACDTDLDSLMLTQSPLDPMKIWLIKKETKNAET